MFTLKTQFELDIINKEHFKIINNDWLITAKGNYLSRINLTNYTPDSGIEFDREIQEIFLLNQEELIVFMGKLSKRCNLLTWNKIEDNEFEKYRISPMTIPGEKILIRQKDAESGSTIRGLYDVSENRIIWKNPALHNPAVINGMLFSNSLIKIERFELETGKMLWSQPISQYGDYYTGRSNIDRRMHEGEVDRFLGIYKNVIWIVLNNGMLLGLNIENGSIAHKADAPKHYPPELFLLEETRKMNIFYNKQSVLDCKNGKIIHLWNAGNSDSTYDWYAEIDLNTASADFTISKVSNLTNMPFTIDGNPCPLWPFDDEYIYVCNYQDYKIALFNRKNKTIKWVYQLEVEPSKRSFIEKMEVWGKFWYILDNSKTLYILEQENRISHDA